MVAIEPMDFKLPDNEVAELLKPIAYAYEQDHDVQVVENLLIVEVVLSGAEIEFVYGEGADKLKQFGGIGAELYYSI